ncbi:class I SAM-dependent methyltransferase [Desulfoglaeba alkanexedens]|uniref:Class I SAM-dependent methyltransferase n=1 Tax=Desulfoglaeba alkanexedens ALDC TaxID=980445 RepID=A0A4P8L3J4_9BACT|nr:methyltransferase domain-containing protein [Desulfoglaeba alkanexedens]QCQ21342.1 class I SAM-dependent methyltransferase [Desulfoglaeba alkanexedens ALDC]
MSKNLLHVGCGPAHKANTRRGFNTPEWEETRFDINPAVSPDIVGDMTNMSNVDSDLFDAVFSSHNIEHLFYHEVAAALREFYRVLNKDGFVSFLNP